MSFRRFFFGLLLFGSLACLAFSQTLYQRFVDRQVLLDAQLRQSTSAELAAASSRLERWLFEFKGVVDAIASDVNSGLLPPHAFQERLAKELEKTPQASGLGIVFFPLASDPDFRKKTPFYVGRGTQHQGDTSIFEEEFGQIVSMLYSGNGSETPLLTGIVVLDFPRTALKDQMLKIELGQHGYTFLIGPDGVFIWHPRDELRLQKKSLFDLAIERNIPSLMAFTREAVRGKTESRDITSPITGKPALAFSSPIPSVGWSLIAAVDPEGPLHPPPAARQLLFFALLSGIAGLVGIALFLALLPETPSFRRLWAASLGISIILFGGIAVVWWLTMQYGEEPIEGSTPLAEPSVVAKFKEDFIASSKRMGWPKPLFIPTGVYIQSIAFEGALSVKVSGYVWQVFDAETASLTEGIILPEATEEVTLNKAYERQDGERRVIGWSFSATLRQWFDYRKYPFDLQSVWLQIWPNDFDKNVILVPDHQSYDILNPQNKPGVRSDIVLPGWDISKSFFSYIPKDYNTSFGFLDQQGGNYFPELFFHVIIQRKFLDPFLANLLPLLVVAFLNFGAILIATRREKLIGLFGFSAGTSMGIAGGLVFVVILAQNDLRQRLEVERLMYLDYYYFVMYLLLITVAIDAIVFAWSRRSWLLHYRDHLIPKLLYWPLTMLLLFIVTVYSFFP